MMGARKPVTLDEVERRVYAVHGDSVDDKSSFSFARIAVPVSSDQLPKGKHKGGNHYDINCLMCNQAFRVTEKQLAKKFCSFKCKNDSLAIEYRGKNYFKRSGQWIECLCCHTRFWMKQSRIDAGKGKYCSRECYIEAHPFKLDSTRCNWYGKPRIYSLFDRYTDVKGRSFRFRSSYEIAFVEQYLDRLGLTWDYEPKTFDVDGFTYTPDFWVHEQQRFIEVKGYLREKERLKLEKFKLKYSSVSFVLATDDVLRSEFGIDITPKTLNLINEKYKIGSYVRHEYSRKKAT